MAQKCWSKRLRDVPDPLGKELIKIADQWITVRAKEGERYYAQDDIHVYGPFPSEVKLQAMLSNADMAITRKERDEITLETGEFAHYLLNAHFVASQEASGKDDESWHN